MRWCAVFGLHVILTLPEILSSIPQPSRNVFVSLVCRSNYKAIAKDGVTLKTRDFGEYHFKPYAVFPSIDAAGRHPPSEGSSGTTAGAIWDFVIVTTKALPDRVDDAQFISPVVSVADQSRPPEKATAIALIQNGVGVEGPHRARYPQNPIVSCVTVISAEQVSHGVVVQNRWTRISLGPYTDGVGDGQDDDAAAKGSESNKSLSPLARVSKQRTEQLASLWTQGGIKDAETHSERSLQFIRWHKLAINASMNPSAVLSGGVGNADMLTLHGPFLREHLRGCMDEIFAAAPVVLGAPFPKELATADRIIKSTERNKGARPSMLLDWEAGRPLELEVILGNPVKIARQSGVECPRLHTMYALLKAAQTKRDEEKAKHEQGSSGKAKL